MKYIANIQDLEWNVAVKRRFELLWLLCMKID